MRDAEFVAAAWILTSVAIGGYWLRVVLGTRRAERSLDAGDGAGDGAGNAGTRT